MKKLIVLLLVLTVLSLAACSPAAPSSQTQPTQPSTEAAPVELDLQAIYDECAKTMPEMIPLDATMMLNYCGIKAEDCAVAVVAICSDGLRTDEIWLIEAVDAAALDRLAAMADARLQAKGEESISYSPEQYAVVQKAKVIRFGNYLAVLVSPDVDTLETVFNTAAGI
jgi:hypothetical protein